MVDFKQKKKWWFQCCLNWLAWKQDGFTKECPHVNPKNLGTCFCFLRRRFSPGGQRWQNWHLYPALGDVDPWSGQTCSVEKAGQIAWPLGPFHFYVHWETWCPKHRTSLQFSKVTKNWTSYDASQMGPWWSMRVTKNPPPATCAMLEVTWLADSQCMCGRSQGGPRHCAGILWIIVTRWAAKPPGVQWSY